MLTMVLEGLFVDQWSQIRMALMRSRIRTWIRLEVKKLDPDPH
jgi:hypothetical protein